MLLKAVWLVALLCCTAALATQQSDCDCGDCDCQVNYKWAAITTKNTEYFGPATFFAVRLNNDRNVSALSWTVQHIKPLDGPNLTVEFEVFKEINECWISVLKQCEVSFCAAPTPVVLSHVALVGLLNSTPPMTSCPIKPNTYNLWNFTPPCQQICNNVVHGKTRIDYEVKKNGKLILSVRLWLEIMCAK